MKSEKIIILIIIAFPLLLIGGNTHNMALSLTGIALMLISSCAVLTQKKKSKAKN